MSIFLHPEQYHQWVMGKSRNHSVKKKPNTPQHKLGLMWILKLNLRNTGLYAYET